MFFNSRLSGNCDRILDPVRSSTKRNKMLVDPPHQPLFGTPGKKLKLTECSKTHRSLHSPAASARLSFHLSVVALCCFRYVFVTFSTASLNSSSSVYDVDASCSSSAAVRWVCNEQMRSKVIRRLVGEGGSRRRILNLWEENLGDARVYVRIYLVYFV